MSTRSLKEHITEDLLTCPVCFDEYDNGVRRPLLLPCRHTVCTSCVESLIQDTNIKCPKDRKIFHVPNGLQGFDVDKTTQDVQNFIRRSSILTINVIKDNFLKCLKCRSDYDEAVHVPLSLPCQHPMCFSCVESGSVYCPKDRSTYMVPMSGFPRNNTLRHLKDLLNSIRNQQGYVRPISSLPIIRTNRSTGARQRQPSWADNIHDFDLEESMTQFDFLPDVRPRGNYMVNFQSKPEYAQRVSPQPFYFPAISNNLHQVIHNMTFNMGNIPGQFRSNMTFNMGNIPGQFRSNMIFNMGNVPGPIRHNMTFYNGNVLGQVGHNMNFNMGIPFQASHNMTVNMESLLHDMDQFMEAALRGDDIDLLNIF